MAGLRKQAEVLRKIAKANRVGVSVNSYEYFPHPFAQPTCLSLKRGVEETLTITNK